MKKQVVPVAIAVVAILLAASFLSQRLHREQEIQVKNEQTKWQREIGGALRGGLPPEAVIAFLDNQRMLHTGYLKTPHAVGTPKNKVIVIFDRHIFTRFGPVTQTSEGRDGWYVATSFEFTAKDALCAWTTAISPTKIYDAQMRNE